VWQRRWEERWTDSEHDHCSFILPPGASPPLINRQQKFRPCDNAAQGLPDLCALKFRDYSATLMGTHRVLCHLTVQSRQTNNLATKVISSGLREQRFKMTIVHILDRCSLFNFSVLVEWRYLFSFPQAHEVRVPLLLSTKVLEHSETDGR
jgi:hypothetical protein